MEIASTPPVSSGSLHQGQPVLHGGARLDQAKAAVIMLHGRGASARDILLLANELTVTSTETKGSGLSSTGILGEPGITFLAPQAAGSTWYPNPFSAPVQSNQPWLSSALDVIQGLVSQAGEAGIPPGKILFVGFSQGACLALEYVARHPLPYGGVAGLSGSLIGPEDAQPDYPGSLDGLPVFLGCSTHDPHIPEKRVNQTAQTFESLGARVEKRLYPGLGHAVNEEEIQIVRGMLDALLYSA